VARDAIDGGLMQAQPFPLWPLPLAIAATLTVAAHLALALSIDAGYVPACVPYFEGCTSISRAARHGLGNHLFRLLVLPCAVLVGLHWWLSARWARAIGHGGRALLVLGLLAAIALAVYATFLGTEGAAYRFLRRYGVNVFFGSSYVAQLLFLRAAMRSGGLPRALRIGMQAVCVAMLLLGLVHVAAMAAIGGSDLQDLLENALEWQLGALLVAWYVLQALVWRRDGYRAEIGMKPPRDP
jgi:hypothetical protein